MSHWTIKFYGDDEDKDGNVAEKSPIRGFLRSLQGGERKAMAHALNLLQEHGAMLRPPYAKPFEGKVWELVGGQHGRIFYVVMPDRKTIYLLHGFRKQTNETPEHEKRLARQRFAEVYPAEPAGKGGKKKRHRR